MEIRFDHKFLKALLEAGVKSPVFQNDRGYARTKDVESRFIDVKDYAIIRKIAAKPDFKDQLDTKRVIRKLGAVESLAQVDSDTKIKKLEILAEVIRADVNDAPRNWMFVEDEGAILPWYVTSVRFHPAVRGRSSDSWTPARVQVTLEAMVRGEKESKSLTFQSGVLPDTVKNVLSYENAMVATPRLIAEFDAEILLYNEHAKKTGEQFLASGTGQVVGESTWSRSKVSFERDGVTSKVIMDDSLGRGSDSEVANTGFWSKKAEEEEDDADEDDNTKVTLLPTHPIVRVFSLTTHDYSDVHISCLEPYVYDAGIIKKLVLPKDVKNLIDALTGSAITRMSDIIRGKAQGVIILCSGLPGTGKTLTAEVYSEAAARPLYVVQCSQLGTDEESLEKHLAEVLERATRWKAILLIDEADVYIHERGDDIQQNAIVGVFLRLLEYYNGILFLTTNRGTVVDDAIMSRMTAHVRYALPEGPDRVRLWEILLAQYGVSASPAFVGAAIEAFPDVSGRSIRQLIRLALLVGAGKDKLKIEHLKHASKFHDFAQEG